MQSAVYEVTTFRSAGTDLAFLKLSPLGAEVDAVPYDDDNVFRSNVSHSAQHFISSSLEPKKSENSHLVCMYYQPYVIFHYYFKNRSKSLRMSSQHQKIKLKLVQRNRKMKQDDK